MRYIEHETSCVGRLTITLDDELHCALKEAAARQGLSMASIIEESLRLRGLQDQPSATALAAQARKRARLAPETASELADEETRAARKPSPLQSLLSIPTWWSLG